MTATVLSITDRIHERLERERVEGARVGRHHGEVVALPIQRPEPEPHKEPPGGANFRNAEDQPVADLTVALWCKSNGAGILTERQWDFICSICESLKRRPLTPKQLDWLAGLHDKIHHRLTSNSGPAA